MRPWPPKPVVYPGRLLPGLVVAVELSLNRAVDLFCLIVHSWCLVVGENSLHVLGWVGVFQVGQGGPGVLVWGWGGLPVRSPGPFALASESCCF